MGLWWDQGVVWLPVRADEEFVGLMVGVIVFASEEGLGIEIAAESFDCGRDGSGASSSFGLESEVEVKPK